MKKTDLTPEKVALMVRDFFIKNNLEFSTTRAENYNKNLKWFLDRKIPNYPIIHNMRYGDVLSFDELPKVLILYSPESGGYIQYIAFTKRYYSYTPVLEDEPYYQSDLAKMDTDTKEYLYPWALENNYDITELILGKNKPFMNWDSFKPWDVK